MRCSRASGTCTRATSCGRRRWTSTPPTTRPATRCPILVRVSESPPFRVRAGVGYATTECFRTQAAWTVRNFLGQGRVLDITGNVSRIGVGRPFDFGFDKNICSVSREDSIGSSRFNYAARRHAAPAGLSLAQQHAESLGVRRAAVGVQGVRPDGHRHDGRAAARDAAAAVSRLRRLHGFLWADGGHAGELLRVLQRLHTRRDRSAPAAPAAGGAYRADQSAAGEQSDRPDAGLERHARGDLCLQAHRVVGVPAVHPGAG